MCLLYWFAFVLLYRLVADAASSIQEIVRKGKSQQEAWNSCSVQLFWAARVRNLQQHSLS